MIKNKEINDELYDIVNNVDLTPEEKEILVQYIEEISLNFKVFSKFLDDKKNISKIVAFLESLTGDSNVK